MCFHDNLCLMGICFLVHINFSLSQSISLSYCLYIMMHVKLYFIISKSQCTLSIRSHTDFLSRQGLVARHSF